jgi:hypothetical protein
MDLVAEAICFVDKATLSVQSANSKFCRAIAPISRFKGLDFLENFVSKEDHERFRVGIARVLELKVLFTLFASVFVFLKPYFQETRNGWDEEIRNSDSTDAEHWRQTPVIRDCHTLVLGSRQASFLAMTAKNLSMRKPQQERLSHLASIRLGAGF